MIIKQADDKQSDLSILKNLLTHPNVDETKRKRIEQEVRNIQAGIRGEDESTYEMKVHFGESKNWMVIHDLRIKHGDVVAQIDHLIINRWLEMWVCESKHFSEGIEINEHGEFSAFFDKNSYGVASPIEQNNKHILILKRLFDSKTVKLPKRLWFITIKPNLKSLVLVSKNAKINRPKRKVDNLDCIIKNDHLFKTIDKALDNSNSLVLFKVVSQKTLEALAREIVKLHKPIKYNLEARFGLSSFAPVAQVQKQPISQITQPISAGEELKKSSQERNYCSCGEKVTKYDETVCNSRKATFEGKVYCKKCQEKLTPQAIQPIPVTEKLQEPSQKQHGCYHCGETVDAEINYCKSRNGIFGGNIYCRKCQENFIQNPPGWFDGLFRYL